MSSWKHKGMSADFTGVGNHYFGKNKGDGPILLPPCLFIPAASNIHGPFCQGWNAH